MRPLTTAPRLAAAALAFLVLPITAARAADEDGFAGMFNGKDLAGWRTTGNWVVEEGNVVVLKPRPGESGWQRYNDYLSPDEVVFGVAAHRLRKCRQSRMSCWLRMRTVAGTARGTTGCFTSPARRDRSRCRTPSCRTPRPAS